MYTKGDWIYNKKRCAIESTTEWLIEPNVEDEEEGIPLTVIDTFSAMGGNDVQSDIDLICEAPRMFELIKKIVQTYDDIISKDDMDMMKSIINKIKE